MFRIIDFKILIRAVAIITTILSILIYEIVHRYWNSDIPLIRVISIAPLVSLLIIVILSSGIPSRAVWWGVRKIDKSLFPDLNGTWEGEILIGEGKSPLPARARIRQTLFQTWVDIHTETSKSQTLESTPAVEGGQCKLYYSYRANPKNPDWHSYYGTTIFDVRHVTIGSEVMLELSGQYFTDRKSNGRVRFRQVSKDVHMDVSYY